MRSTLLATLPLLLSALGAAPVPAQEQAGLEARVWLDRGEEPVLRRGDQVRIYYRTSEDAYAAIFRIDTDGVVTMVFPPHPGASEAVLGGRDYRLLLPRSPAWMVEDDPGSGYFFIVASPDPLDFSAFGYDTEIGWDLGAVGGTIYEDPYVAIDEYVARVVPGWEIVPYALDFLTYHVGNTYSYPRFLCYDCHTPQPYRAWNPYAAVCTSFRVVVWDDPYFYPAYRYSGTHVVVARPARSVPRYGVRARLPGDIGVRPLVLARTPPRRALPQFKESPTVAPTSRIPVRRGSASSTARPPAAAQRGAAGAAGRPTLQRRPSARLPVRSPAGVTSRGTPREEPRATPGRRPTRVPARPAAPRTAPTRSSAGPPRPSAPAASGRPAAARPPTTRSAPSGPRGRSSPAPARGGARPSTGAAPRPTARPAPAPRAPAPRPTVRPRGTTRRGN